MHCELSIEVVVLLMNHLTNFFVYRWSEVKRLSKQFLLKMVKSRKSSRKNRRISSLNNLKLHDTTTEWAPVCLTEKISAKLSVTVNLSEYPITSSIS